MLVGIDEVGRGCWAGPLVAAAVALPAPIDGLRDSKRLSARQRGRLDILIRAGAAYGIGWVSPAEVDDLGLTAAVALAMRRALEALPGNYDEIIIDGNLNFLPDVPGTRALIRADDAVPAVSAASIIAKVARDAYMARAAIDYPGYGFERHVGYGTAQHRAALVAQGICVLHRKSYAPIKAFI